MFNPLPVCQVYQLRLQQTVLNLGLGIIQEILRRRCPKKRLSSSIILAQSSLFLSKTFQKI